jgi:GTP-dependent phosphoenolpyruvate carboxykinase
LTVSMKEYLRSRIQLTENMERIFGVQWRITPSDLSHIMERASKNTPVVLSWVGTTAHIGQQIQGLYRHVSYVVYIGSFDDTMIG